MRSKLSRQIVTIMSIALVLVIILAGAGFLLASYYSMRSSLKMFSEKYSDIIGEIDHVYQLENSLKNFSDQSFIIVLYSSEGEIIAANASDPPQDITLSDLQSATSGNHVYSNDNYNDVLMLIYTAKVFVKTSIDTSGYIYMRCGTPIDYATGNFWIFFGSSIVIAMLVIAAAGAIINVYIKKSSRPLQAVQKGLEEINKGNFRRADIATDYDEYKGIINEIGDLGKKISDSLSNIKYEQRKAMFLLDNIGQGVIALSENGRVLMCNSAALTIFERHTSTVGMNIQDLVGDENICAIVNGTVENKVNCECEYRRQGKVYRVETVLADDSWFENFKSISMLILFTDITQEIKSADIRSEFFANASHELKTPLTVIKGYSELLTMPGQSAKNIAKCAAEIEGNAAKMGTLINDMLYISRLDANIINEEKQYTDIGKLCSDICDDMSVSASMASVTIHCSGQGCTMAYPKMMTTAVTNLVSNAVKYNKEGGEVWVNVSEDGGDVVISVRDNGIGISPEDKERVFERFYKADKAHTRNDELSTGLGLAIVKHIIVNLHEGEITVDSEPGKGSVFTVRLPEISATEE